MDAASVVLVNRLFRDVMQPLQHHTAWLNDTASRFHDPLGMKCRYLQLTFNSTLTPNFALSRFTELFTEVAKYRPLTKHLFLHLGWVSLSADLPSILGSLPNLKTLRIVEDHTKARPVVNST